MAQVTTPDRQALVDAVVKHEGLRLKPYVDTAGKTTIGVGRNLTDCGISAREAMDLLDHDLDACITDLAAVYPWYVTLSPARQIAVTDLRFQLGHDGLADFRFMLAALAMGHYTVAAQELRASKLANEAPARTEENARAIEGVQ